VLVAAVSVKLKVTGAATVVFAVNEVTDIEAVAATVACAGAVMPARTIPAVRSVAPSALRVNLFIPTV
jgi:hypothetical protein